jgi:hypothetical protein
VRRKDAAPFRTIDSARFSSRIPSKQTRRALTIIARSTSASSSCTEPVERRCPTSGKRLTAEIETHADKTVAHLDKKGYGGAVTFNDLDAAIDALDRIACKYISVLTAKGYPSLEASIVFDWKKIFSVPWRRQRLIT